MVTEDKLLREASDPTTRSERLEAIFWANDPWAMREEDFFSPRVSLYRALLANPALPHSCVADAITVMPRATTYAAWLNPSLPLLLLSRPDLAREDMARLSLTFAQSFVPAEQRSQVHTLEDTVAHWHLQGPGQDITSGRAFVWQLARHLASLFGLPWPK